MGAYWVFLQLLKMACVLLCFSVQLALLFCSKLRHKFSCMFHTNVLVLFKVTARLDPLLSAGFGA